MDQKLGFENSVFFSEISDLSLKNTGNIMMNSCISFIDNWFVKGQIYTSTGRVPVPV